jgi:hypothetical protein
MQELVYYSDNATKITNDTIKLGGKSYRLADLSSVDVGRTQTDPSRNAPSFLVVAGSLLMFTVNNLQEFIPVEWDVMLPFTLALGVLIALSGLIILVMQMLLKTDYIYMVCIKGTFGTACPFASDDEHYVRTVANALRTALRESRAASPAAASTLTSETMPQ